MMVVLPDPEGAAKIISLPDIIIVIARKDKENYYMKAEQIQLRITNYELRNFKSRKSKGGRRNEKQLRITNYELRCYNVEGVV